MTDSFLPLQKGMNLHQDFAVIMGVEILLGIDGERTEEPAIWWEPGLKVR